MKHTIPRIAVVLAAFVAMGAEAADMKIGFVDVERISRESAPAERASKQLEKEFAPRRQELQRREARIKELQGQLEREAMTMTESDRRAKEQELARTNVEFQRMQREFREDLTIRRNQEIQGLMERANRVIRKIAEAGKFDLVIQDAVYRDPRIDITDQVLKALAEPQ
ncbi:MAG TPA: OmpH family outer membrane protein [Burkholderiales bacterium]